MFSRRRFLSAATASAAALGVAQAHATANAALSAEPGSRKVSATRPGGVSRFVDLTIGTGGHGHVFMGATVPFGMVQVGPDTFTDGWDHCSGYHYTDESLQGFSHTHLSGTGCGDLLDVLLMPRSGRIRLDAGSLFTAERGNRSRYSHKREVAVPGYYSVYLRDPEVQAELTATERAAMHRYSFAADAETPHVLLDFLHCSGPEDKMKKTVAAAELQATGGNTLTGSRTVLSWARGRDIYFAARFSEPWSQLTFYSDNQPVAGSAVQGHALKAAVQYKKLTAPLCVKVAISGVSVEQALKNLDAEMPAWDFDGIRARAEKLWEEALSRITIDADERTLRIFYTSLYHCMLAPTLFSDVDGQYRGMDGKNHQLQKGDENFSTYSLWDTYRAWHPLMTLIDPERAAQMINGLIRMANESPSGPPIWPLQAKETFCMTGWHSISAVAEAVAKQLPGLKVKDFIAPIRKVGFSGNYRGHESLRSKGYIPCDLSEESIGNGLDFVYNDWAMAAIFAAAGDTATAAELRQRAGNYRNFFNPANGYMHSRMADGSWSQPFTPNETGYSTKWRDYTESNPYQATFAVQHDPEGLAQLMGGRHKLEERLDDLFNADSTLPEDAPPDIAGLVGQYAHGNEPCHHIAFLYMYAGVPWKTQARVQWLLRKMYADEPDGLAGNEDCGQMSAWYILAALGLYAVDPVSTNYVITTPAVRHARIPLAAGKQLEIVVESGQGDYIQSLSWNSKPLDRLWISHKELMTGGKLSFVLGKQPNKTLGVEPGKLPPSMTAVKA